MNMQMPRSITMYTDKQLYLDTLHERCLKVTETCVYVLCVCVCKW